MDKISHTAEIIPERMAFYNHCIRQPESEEMCKEKEDKTKRNFNTLNTKIKAL